jgi:SAM-dependent methyltransferase
VPAGAFVVDLGSGLGMLPVLLGVVGDGRRALGVEWDAAKVACAVHAARDLPGIDVVAGDARSFAIPPCDVVTLVDMLHYWDVDTQRAILGRCRAALRPGGRLLVREGDPARRGGARFTRAVERLVTRLGWNRGPAVHFRPIAELRADLTALGFDVTSTKSPPRRIPATSSSSASSNA